jgi:hypothetical protein
VDNRYSNGADEVIIAYMQALASNSSCVSPAPTSNPNGLSFDRIAYAGWNTDGNTLGDSISHAIVLYYFASFGPFRGYTEADLELVRQFRSFYFFGQQASDVETRSSSTLKLVDPVKANGYYNTWRITEDNYWQALLRQTLSNYISQVNGDTTDTLANDLSFYERYSLKVLGSRVEDISGWFGQSWTMSSLYYPWNRTFEIGGFLE